MTPKPDRLTCEELFRRLDDYMDRELTAAEAAMVRDHLESCAACATAYTFESSILTNVRAKLQRIAAPADLMAKISARLADAERRERP